MKQYETRIYPCFVLRFTVQKMYRNFVHFLRIFVLDFVCTMIYSEIKQESLDGVITDRTEMKLWTEAIHARNLKKSANMR